MSEIKLTQNAENMPVLLKYTRKINNLISEYKINQQFLYSNNNIHISQNGNEKK